MAGFAIVGWVFTGLLLVLVVVCAAAARGWIPANHLAGVRLPSLTASGPAWRAGHAAALLPATAAFAAALTCSIVGLALPAAHVGSVVAFIVGVAWAFVRADAAARLTGHHINNHL